MKILSSANQKGGVLKSTTALSLAINFSRMGKRVLLIDFDPQHSLSETLILSDEDIERKTIFKALLETQGVRDCIEVISPTLHFIPCDLELEQLPSTLVRLGRVNQYILLDVLELISGDYDVCIIDCPPNNTFLNTLALSASNYVIVPTHKSNWTRKGTEFVLDSIRDMMLQKRSHVNIKNVILLPTAINRKRRRLFSDGEFRKFTDGLHSKFDDGFVRTSSVTIPHDEDASYLEDIQRDEIPSLNLNILKIYHDFIVKENLIHGD